VERCDEDVGPAPGAVDFEAQLAAATDEAGGDVQQLSVRAAVIIKPIICIA